MGRLIGSAVAGYVVIFVMVFALMTAAWFAVGVEGTFQPNAWEVTGLWNALMLIAAVVAAAVGGYVAAMIAKDPKGPQILIGIVVVLGLALAIPVLIGADMTARGPRPAELPMMEAMMNGIQPAWVALLNPLFGVIGVLVGMKIRFK